MKKFDYDFNVGKVAGEVIDWIAEWFENNGKNCNAVIGISGGKDSSVVAALCVKALGKNRVIGVMMPNGQQGDINVSYDLIRNLDIQYTMVNIEKIIKSCKDGFFLSSMSNVKTENEPIKWSNQTKINLPPRIRMAMLYAISQSCNGRVANTCNLSEDWIGYSTRWGDSVGDFSPLANLTSDEVIAIGGHIGLPQYFTRKTPADGLCGKTDEDNFGFTYEVLNKYIRTGVCDNSSVKDIIDYMHKKNLFKMNPIPSYNPNINI